MFIWRARWAGQWLANSFRPYWSSHVLLFYTDY